MPGAPRSPRPVPAPRPLTARLGAAGVCSDAARNVLTRPIVASRVSPGDRHEGGGSSGVGPHRRVLPPPWSGSSFWLGSPLSYHLAPEGGRGGAPGPLCSGERPSLEALGTQDSRGPAPDPGEARARASLPDPSGESRPAVRAQRAATGGVRRSEPGSAEGNARELSARAFSCRPRCRQGVCKRNEDSRTPALTAHPQSLSLR
uniref:Uncharacterized protein n=1 Tax=Mustela putorius furo TaxID=9669 RepID=M3YP94_MUSPF